MHLREEKRHPATFRVRRRAFRCLDNTLQDMRSMYIDNTKKGETKLYI